MAEKSFTAKERGMVDAFFAKCENLSRADFDIGMSKSGNIKITRLSDKNMAVIESESGKLLSIDTALKRDAGLEGQNSSHCFKKPPRPFSDEELAALRKAASDVLSSDEFGKCAKRYKLEPSASGTSVNISFEPYAKSAYKLADIHLAAPARKAKDAPAKAAEALSSSLVLVPRPQTREKAARKIADYITKRRKQHAKILSNIPEAKPESFAFAISSGCVNAAYLLASSSDFEVSPDELAYSDGTFTFAKQAMEVVYIDEGGRAFFGDVYESQLQNYFDAHRHAKSIESILVCVASEGKGEFGLADATYSSQAGTLGIVVQGTYDSYSASFELARGYKRAVKAFIEMAGAGEDAQRRAEAERVVSLVSCGDILTLAAAHVINVNSDFITENRVVKILRGLKTTQYTELHQTAYDGKFNLIPEEDVRQAIRKLLADGLIWEKFVSGQYSDYYILKPKSLVDVFIRTALDSKAQVQLLGDKARTFETVRYKVYSGIPNMKNIDDDLDYLVEHPAIWCWKSENVRSWLENLPDEHKEYLKLRVKLEDDKHVKKYIKQLSDASMKKEPAPARKPAPAKKAAPKPKAEPQYKAVKSDKLSSRWEQRFVVIETETGEIVDNAQGWGYKSASKAMAGWNYRRKRRQARK